MKGAQWLRGLVVVGLGCVVAAPAAAQAVRAKDVAVTVRVKDGVASTHLEVLIHNSGSQVAEADWILPLPPGAVADAFTMTVGGVETAGEVLGAQAARGVYEDIVRRRRDPGLLEYHGRGCLRARVFPIPARGSVSVRVSFRSVLPESGGLWRWSFAARAAGVGGRAPERLTLDWKLESSDTLRSVYSPIPGLETVLVNEHEARASYESSGASVATEDLAVFYGLSDEEFGLHLLSHGTKTPGQEGTFLMLISPKRDWDESRVLAKEIVFVMDTSGSMAGAKMEQAKGALAYFLKSLRAEDRFNVVPFATAPEPFFEGPVEATSANLELALAKAQRLRAEGGTNIHESMLMALGERLSLAKPQAAQRVPMVVLLTDGQPTVGEKDPERILAAVRERNAERARVFVFGVGNDVNTILLDTLAAQSGGTRDYVAESEDIEAKTSELFRKLSRPVLSDLKLGIDGLEVSRIVPSELPDLFVGSKLVVVGRYRGSGPCAVRLSGSVQGERREYVYEGTFADAPVSELAFLPSLWAERRVALLLDAIRLSGPEPELLGEVERLGREYRIVTPYTSHLIVEEGLRLSRADVGSLRGTGERTPAPSGRFRAGTTLDAPATPEPGLDGVVERLRAARVLSDDADREQVALLAGEIARNLREGGDELEQLGRSATGDAGSWSLGKGEQAVGASVYLAKLKDGRAGAQNGKALDLFSQRVHDKVFLLRAGIWTDRTIDPGLDLVRVSVEAYTAEYFALLREVPELHRYFAFSSRMAVRVGDKVFEVTAPGKSPSSVLSPGAGTR